MPAFRDTLPMILNVTLDSVMPIYRELFARYGLTEQQWRCLRVLWDEGDVTTTHLSRQTLLPAPSLVGILDRLERKGLVARKRTEDDRRKVIVVATANGRALHQAVSPMLARIHAQITDVVSADEWQAMRSTLAAINETMAGASLDAILAAEEPV